MVDGVVSHENASRHQVRHDGLITAIIYFLLGIKKTETYEPFSKPLVVDSCG